MSPDTDPVLQLGRDLADALDPSDVVGRWMSHHLAELISRCEQAPGDKELAATTRAVVLALWERKAGAPFQDEPFAYLGPVLRAIGRLEADPHPWAHYGVFGDQAPPSTAELATYPVLQLASDLDREVGQLVRLSVAVAARAAGSLEEPWARAGIALAITEEDRAARSLEVLERRLRFTARQKPSDTDDGGAAEPEGPEATTARVQPERPDVGGVVDGPELLVGALRRAATRCRRVFDDLDAELQA